MNCLRNELICDHHDMIVIAVNIHFFILAIEIMHYKFDTEALDKLHINAVKLGNLFMKAQITEILTLEFMIKIFQGNIIKMR